MSRILVVDDQADNVYLLRKLLEGNGHTVDEARHGAEALDMAEQAPPDLVIADLLMPEVDGYALLRRWRRSATLADTPFIVYTATYTDPKDEHLAMALGADAFVVKPAEPDALMSLVGDVLARHACGELAPARQPAADEQVLLSEHNEVLVNKLQMKAAEAERANRELRTEIAERRAAEERLRDSEQRYRATFEQAAVGMAHVGRDGRFLRVNGLLCTMTGYTREELLERTFAELTHPTDLEEAEQARTEMLDGKRASYSAEKRYLRRNGDLFWVNVVTTPLFDEAGAPDYFITVIVDISDRKLLEGELRQAQKIEAVGQLAGGVAHDFNNLLTIIVGCTDLLREAPGLEEADRELVGSIADASERASDLTRQLLGFSRRSMLQPRVLDINEVVGDASQMLRRLLDARIVLNTTLAPDVGRVKVDPSQLDQVLLNLVVNARDAMPDGGQLTLETSSVFLSEDYLATHPDCRPGPHVRLAVSDTGSGMPRDVLARVFEPYYTTKDPGKGTGMGLSMVHGIVQQSGGCIHAYSEPGHGTTFKIYLPLADAPAAVDADAEAQVPAGRGTETILLVEDDDAVRALAARTLEAQGYELLVARDGGEALALGADPARALDLLLSDVVMPKLGGPELASRLRECHPNLKVLLTSGYTDDAVVRHGLIAGETAFVQKPYRSAQLLAKVRSVLDE